MLLIYIQDFTHILISLLSFIISLLCLSCLMVAWIGRFLMKDFHTFLSLAMSLLTFLSFRSFLITSFHIFLGHPLWILPLKIIHLLNQALSSILSRWPNHCSLLPCKHSLVLFSFSLVFRSSEEILSSGLTLHINLAIPASFASMIPSSFLTGQDSFPYSIMQCTHAGYILSFALQADTPLANKGTKSQTYAFHSWSLLEHCQMHPL